ncbi:efflux transporter outer membrane subunit [Dyella nitratireducens]|uniref:Outer membrane efflux protein n=1 Tax=Dyella nitratireducens TaxID=1849580 RepID=A0ABQ1GEK6_9GAMM|nr:efflux transporter outer membrane subunit [Dyella nitratireducens]GGA42236.1 outer membrane efflux protein [Dyella nitratireducens]GLQ42032.1 outer membrane efflux protein [Dyella nitratireducens]
MVMLRSLLAACICIAFVGCAEVGPDYHVPTQAVVNAPAAQGGFVSASAATSAAALPPNWWKLYNDPTLDRLIAQTLAANTQLRFAEANLEHSDALLIDADSQRFAGSVDASTAWNHPSEEAVLKRVGVTPYQNYNGGVSVSYDLDLFGAIRRGVEAARADDEAAVAARDLVRVNVVADTVRAYADVCNAGHEIALAQKRIDVEQDDVRMTQELVSHGRASPLDSTRQQDALATINAQLPTLEAAQRNALFRLATLAGQPPANADRALLACHTPLHLNQPLPVGDGQALLKRRPDVRAAERHLAAATARIGIATAALYPDIKFGISVGSTGKAVDGLTGYTNRFAIGPMVSWNLNRNAVRAHIDEANAQSHASLAAFDGTVLNALREVETSLDTYAADLDKQEQLRVARDSAEHRALQAQELEQGGRIDSLASLAAERDRWTAEQAVAAGEAALNHDQVDVFLALGGGW